MNIDIKKWGKYANDVRFILAALGDKKPAGLQNPLVVDNVQVGASLSPDGVNVKLTLLANGRFYDPAYGECEWETSLGYNDGFEVPLEKFLKPFSAFDKKNNQKVVPPRSLLDQLTIKKIFMDSILYAAKTDSSKYHISLKKLINISTGETRTDTMSWDDIKSTFPAILASIEFKHITQALNSAIENFNANVLSQLRSLSTSNTIIKYRIQKISDGHLRMSLLIGGGPGQGMPTNTRLRTDPDDNFNPREVTKDIVRANVVTPPNVIAIDIKGKPVEYKLHNILDLLKDLYKDDVYVINTIGNKVRVDKYSEGAFKKFLERNIEGTAKEDLLNEISMQLGIYRERPSDITGPRNAPVAPAFELPEV